MLKPLESAAAAETLALEFSNVTKTYRLYGSLREQAMDVLGIRIPFLAGKKTVEFCALNGIDLKVCRGEQVGIVGRNGAGKTTLLKMLTGNFVPSSGAVSVNGAVQALMQTGLGFHPEFTGEENLRSALAYNGLQGEQLDKALRDATEFVELGQFLKQPLKTYSLGMRSRLQFAAATAIHPDILVIDEVLGAGDAYFSGKSAARMKQLTSTNCTLLLVSHSMQQILQFCQRCVWIEAGKIVMDGPALEVVRAYEEYTRRLTVESEVAQNSGQGSVLADEGVRSRLLEGVRTRSADAVSFAIELDTNNVSRWPADEDGLRISKMRMLDSQGEATRVLRAGEPASVEMFVTATKTGHFLARFAVVLNREDGFVAVRLVSEYLRLDLMEGQTTRVTAGISELCAGGSRYIASAAIYKELDLESGVGKTYDLISRCFELRVLPKYREDVSLFYQPTLWKLEVV
jgi:lipopolysaccharide transport system ATP-binding protein